MPQNDVELNGLLDKTAVTSSDIATHTQKNPALSQDQGEHHKGNRENRSSVFKVQSEQHGITRKHQNQSQPTTARPGPAKNAIIVTAQPEARWSLPVVPVSPPAASSLPRITHLEFENQISYSNL
ncbi:hypothetical protein PoB_002155800 [Plakobranchus ocellatus]|uniref:Uncharacterized protein n=1 Tax=Plakobranchus ocellatus TaxID=259542 RepID=A0AAV3ZKF8_9GAST|nr:hypothetical protein PoB_002155800 [Plakobranchus ocellatus]